MDELRLIRRVRRVRTTMEMDGMVEGWSWFEVDVEAVRREHKWDYWICEVVR